MNISQFNYIESVLWFFISAILATQALRKTNSRYFKLLVVSSLNLLPLWHQRCDRSQHWRLVAPMEAVIAQDYLRYFAIGVFYLVQEN